MKIKTKKLIFIIFSFVIALQASFAQEKNGLAVFSPDTENISSADSAWLPGALRDKLSTNLGTYTNFVIVDNTNERKIKTLQAKSEGSAYNKETAIQIGNLTSAQYALFSTLRSSKKSYILTISLTNLSTGERKAMAQAERNTAESLFSGAGCAVDELTIALCDKINLPLTPTQKYVLTYGEAGLSSEDKLKLAKNEQEKFEKQTKDLDNQIKILSLSTDLDAASKKAQAEAEKALLEQKLKNAERESERLAQENQKRIEDQKKDALRTQEQKQKRDEMSKQIFEKTQQVRSLKADDSVFSQIQVVEAKKRALIEINDEVQKSAEEILGNASDGCFQKLEEIQKEPYRAAELSNGVPTEQAKKRREDKISSMFNSSIQKTKGEIAELGSSVKPQTDALEKEISADNSKLGKTKTLSSIRDEIKTSFGSYDGDSNSWPVKIYAYLGENPVFQDEISIFYSKLPGKNPTSNADYEKYLDTVDMYNSLIERSEPIFTFEIDYSVKPCGKDKPSQYKVNFDALKVTDTISGKNIEIKKYSDKNYIFESKPVYVVKNKEKIDVKSELYERVADSAFEKGNYEEAKKYFANGKNVRTSKSEFYLELFGKDTGSSENFKKAAEWYKNATEKGDAEAQYQIGKLYFDGEFVKQDYQKAAEWCEKSANQGNADAQCALGNLYYYGYGVMQDYWKAREWYEKAAVQGYATAQYNLGFLYYYGYGVKQDYVKAREWYEKAAAQGYANAQYNLGGLYYNGYGVKQDYVKAKEWYEKSANQGNADAQYSLGYLYYYGYGVKKNYGKAKEWYEKSANQGNAFAQNNLGMLYEDGLGVKQDYVKAKEWYEKAANQGAARAQNNLGLLYVYGRGVKQDYVKAREWFEKSANQGNAVAQNNLGLLYEYGLGVKQDYVKAKEWFKKAAAQGNEAAIKLLKDF